MKSQARVEYVFFVEVVIDSFEVGVAITSLAHRFACPLHDFKYEKPLNKNIASSNRLPIGKIEVAAAPTSFAIVWAGIQSVHSARTAGPGKSFGPAN
jgi:hypothetical protein